MIKGDGLPEVLVYGVYTGEILTSFGVHGALGMEVVIFYLRSVFTIILLDLGKYAVIPD
jgi:hypothetical protein